MDATGVVVAVVGLLIAILVVAGVFLTIFKIFGGLKRQNQERDRLLREGIQASARVLNVQMGGMTMTVGVHRHLQLQIALEVHPQGRPPYQANLTTMVSELQIPQIQPGATLTVRHDPNNPMKLALEGVGAPAAQPQGYGAAPVAPGHAAGVAYGAQGYPPGQATPAAYAQPNAMGYGPTPAAGAGGYPATGGMVPVQGMPSMPKGAKIGLVIGLIGAVVGIGVAVVVVAINVLGVDLSGAAGSSGSEVCARAARCCEAIGGPASACQNYGRVGVPDSACQTALEGYQSAASAQGKSCQ